MRTSITYLTLLALIITPFQINAAGTDGPAPITKAQTAVKLTNVQLSKDGELVGQYVTKAGIPVPNAAIVLRMDKRTEKVTTDQNGRFAFTKLHSGQCVFQAGNDIFACRVWQFDVAPPRSLTSIAMVNSEDVVRGNGWIPSGALLPLSPKSQLGLGLLALGGIGVAIAVSQDDDAS